MGQTKTLEAKIGCKAIMKDHFRFCSEKPDERTCACQGPSIMTYEGKKLVSTYICQNRKYK